MQPSSSTTWQSIAFNTILTCYSKTLAYTLPGLNIQHLCQLHLTLSGWSKYRLCFLKPHLSNIMSSLAVWDPCRSCTFTKSTDPHHGNNPVFSRQILSWSMTFINITIYIISVFILYNYSKRCNTVVVTVL